MSDSPKTDILVLGATGFTGSLISKYLATHPQRKHFSFSVGARSLKKLEGVVTKLDLPSSIKLVQVDVTNNEELERAVKGTRVVINTVGPYWTWGTPVVRACVRNGIHYVDLTGETPWVKQIIVEFDYAATKTGSIIVPQCGFDSIPSDISAYLANKTFKSIQTRSEPLYPATSLSAFRLRGAFSGGTLSTVMTMIDDVPKHIAKISRAPYCLSPFVGAKPPPMKFFYKLPIPGLEPLQGMMFFMSRTNKALVQRSYGLFELQAAQFKDSESELKRYGPAFTYDEFLALRGGVMTTFFYTAALIFGISALLLKPLRPIVKKFIPQAGEGPSEEVMQNGFFNVTNITSSDSYPPVQVKTVMKAKGDPGYAATSIMISEAALSLILPPPSQSATIKGGPGQNSNLHALGPLARQGGILTAMTAFGDVLIQRLEETGSFQFSSSVVSDPTGKKTT